MQGPCLVRLSAEDAGARRHPASPFMHLLGHMGTADRLLCVPPVPKRSTLAGNEMEGRH